MITQYLLLICLAALLTGCQSSSRRIGEYNVPPKPSANPEHEPVEEQLTANVLAENPIVQTQAAPAIGNTAAVEQAAESNRWTRWMERFRQPKRIPFPRTDLQAEPAETEMVDLQQQLGEF